MLLCGGKKIGVGCEVGLEEGRKIEIERKVVADLLRGEVEIIPMELIFFDLELNGIRCDPTRKNRGRYWVPRETLSAEKCGG